MPCTECTGLKNTYARCADDFRAAIWKLGDHLKSGHAGDYAGIKAATDDAWVKYEAAKIDLELHERGHVWRFGADEDRPDRGTP